MNRHGRLDVVPPRLTSSWKSATTTCGARPRGPPRRARRGRVRRGGGRRVAAVGSVVGEVLERAQETGRIRRDVGAEGIYFLVRGVAQAQAFLPVDPEVRRRAIQV